MLARMKIRHFPQCVDGLVPFYALRHAPHRSCLPCPLPVCKTNIEFSLLPKDGLETGKIVRSQDWRGRAI
jgi:hypothetical protein